MGKEILLWLKVLSLIRVENLSSLRNLVSKLSVHKKKKRNKGTHDKPLLHVTNDSKPQFPAHQVN